MFCILFGWRKASKCKKLIKQLQYRLKLLKNKSSSIGRLLREDMAQLIQNSNEQKAFNLAEQLYKEENRMAVYELLDNFCEFIRSNLSYIRKNKDCPNDINEAASSLIYASSRCGDLPELSKIRELFEERYGQRFALASAELLPGNLVNCQIKEKLCINSVSDDVKHQLMDEIVKDFYCQPEILAIEYAPDLQQVEGNNRHEISGEIKPHEMSVNSELIRESESNRLNQSPSQRNSDANSTSISSSIAQKSSPDMFDLSEHNKAGKVGNFTQYDSSFDLTVAGGTKEHREERITAASSSERLSVFDEEKVVYLDDIEEFQSSMPKDGDSQDQRFFKFKPSVQPKTETAESYEDQDESWSEKSSSRSSRKSAKTSRKQSRRRSFSLENSDINDIECKAYYEKPLNSSSSKHRSHYRREHQRKTSVEESKQALCTELGRKFQSFNYNDYAQMKLCHCHLFCERKDSLEHSSNVLVGDEEEWEIPHIKLPTGIRKLVKVPVYDLKSANVGDHSLHRKSEEIERPALHQKSRRRSYDYGGTEYNIFTYPGRWQYETVHKTEVKAEGFDSPGGCADANILTSKPTSKRPQPSYMTVKSMPVERPKESHISNILRSNSLPCKYPEHVHPKLPDYDDIAAKFTALRKERQQNKQQESK
ncbi:uncharacterized protein LOC123196818 isoform X2 [Mangifera indica]|uniref:uncharacterized protein LOC123196818 isoform X2 n=1 Tax=Mangifera indica TaxID=29780 RepID=UPI001CFB4BA9|nr:uncharacterized protein LOC123196818 isoform X2 [Mangifera indica]